MTSILPLLAPLSLIIVAIILAFGLINMARSGSANRSQKLMRWRVIAQFIAIILIMTSLFILG